MHPVIWLFVSPWNVAHQAPLSKEFSRQEFWSGLPCPPPGDPPYPGIEPASLKSPAQAGGIFTTIATWKNSNLLATWCKDLTHWKRPWCWERLKAGEEGDNRGWDGWMASPTQWTWVWVSSRNWWWTGKPGVLQIMGSQSVRQDWGTGLNWF